MKAFVPSSSFLPTLAIVLAVVLFPVHAQIRAPCTASMISTFSPCMNYLTNSTANGTSPTSDCCNSLKSLMSNGTDCMCLIATGSIPFQIPINRTLAISLPRACNMPGVPLQCKASIAPIPAPGPIALGPSLSPSAPAALTPTAPPEADATPALTPPSTTVGSEAPTSNSGIRPVLTPSAAEPSLGFSPSLLLTLFGAVVLKYY
ncbi:bifunctional inhibitor/lipid-transfer protein/seed storage 2S albumin superfamily protein [Actinidia rufa]|uniref:Bifunctional inhibitor/lipid-transfer protein/seed storage 2S albumin superfamily protein n=1 Tax=Actinidia rufa TaxID=165716 RepID=A0A7J0GTT9_9ERIC|nr:bifunctional inhibitor/lipid-transfer protein/seed storage 2S albumin superfamily protein [Actinidia rufa]